MVGRKSVQLACTLISVTFFVFAVPTYARTASSQIADCEMNLRVLNVAMIWRNLLSPTLSAKTVIDDLSRDPELGRLLRSSAGVTEGFMVDEHSILAIQNLLEQFERYRTRFAITAYQNVRLLPTLVMTMALHDIGKPLAVVNGVKDMQHQYTIPILEKTMMKLKFTSEEIQLARALVANHVVGRLVRKLSVGRQAFLEMSLQANYAHIPVSRYAPLQLLFYTADAGAYTTVKNLVLNYDRGVLLPKNVDLANFGIKASPLPND